MSATTLFQATNKVLRRLRERQVSSIADNAYATLVASFVQDANDYVESRWEWVGLELTIPITTVSGTAEYELNNIGETGTIEHVVDDTNNRILLPRSIERIRIEAQINPVGNNQPSHYAISSIAADGDSNITFYPTPDGIYTINVQVDKSGSPLLVDADLLLVPLQPVMQMAYAMALDERGDTGGTSGRSQFALAEVYIATAIMRDSQKRPENLIWTVAGDRPERTNHGSGTI